MRLLQPLLLSALLPLARAVLPLACMCTVNEKVLTNDYSPFVGCGAHLYDSRWCNVMDPENCKDGGFDCDVCDDPDDCEHHYHKETCEVQGGVHLWDRYAKIYHPGVYWKFCSGDRCVPLRAAPYQAGALEEIAVGFLESMEAEDWPDCCRLCGRNSGCVAWKWVYPAAPQLEAAPAWCSIYRLKPGVDAGAVKGSWSRYDEGDDAYRYARNGNEMTVWGVRGFDDAPTSCFTRGEGMCNEDLYVFVGFCCAFSLLTLFSVCCCTFNKWKFRTFAMQGIIHAGVADGVTSWEETYTWTDKNGTHTGKRQRYRSKIEFQANGRTISTVFTDRDSKSVCGGVCYDKSMAAKIYKKGRHSIKVCADSRDPDEFITKGPWLLEIVVHVIGLAFVVTTWAVALRSAPYVVRNQGAVNYGKRDEALSVPGWGDWSMAYWEGFEGSEWASFYDVDMHKALAMALSIIGVVAYVAILLADAMIIKSIMDLNSRLQCTKKVVAAQVVGVSRG